jgi:hypothetical protein
VFAANTGRAGQLAPPRGDAAEPSSRTGTA